MKRIAESLTSSGQVRIRRLLLHRQNPEFRSQDSALQARTSTQSKLCSRQLTSHIVSTVEIRFIQNCIDSSSAQRHDAHSGMIFRD